MQHPPLIVHILFRLGIGGIENGLVNIINNMPHDAYRHAIVCLTNSTDFKERLTRKEVEIYELNKQEGQDWGSFVKLYQLLKRIKPTVVNTNNLGAIEYQVVAFLAGVKCRVHGELGWDVFDPDGSNVKYQWIRRIIKPFIHHFIPLSIQLENYLIEKIHVSPEKITRICNGVDDTVFYPLVGKKNRLDDCPFSFNEEEIIIGAVGRMHGVKDQLTLVKAFILMCERAPELKDRVKLIIIGDGPLRAQALTLLEEKQLTANAWLPGERNDITEIMRRFDLFIQPSQAEGISNTILEAMATGLPVIATDVGGNPELVSAGENGYLTPVGDFSALAEKMLTTVQDKNNRQKLGQHSRLLASTRFSLATMLEKYQAVYDSLVQK